MFFHFDSEKKHLSIYHINFLVIFHVIQVFVKYVWYLQSVLWVWAFPGHEETLVWVPTLSVCFLFEVMDEDANTSGPVVKL